MARHIPVAALRTGMTVLSGNPHDGFKVDCHLTGYFKTSSKVPTISFYTGPKKTGPIVVWHNCGYVCIQ